MEEQWDPVMCSVCLQDGRVNSCCQCGESFSSETHSDLSVASVTDTLEEIDLQTHEDQADAEADVKCETISSCQHTDVSTGKTHLPEDITERLEERTCPQHDKHLEVYCHTDRRCICFLCMLDEHKGHDVVSVAIGRAERQTQLEDTKKKVTDQERELKDIKKTSVILQNQSQATEEESKRIFTELIGFMRTSQSDTVTLIQNQMRVEMERIQRHVDGLEEKISEQKRTQSELDRLSQTEDHVSYLQKVQSYWSTDEHEDFPSLTSNSQFSFGEIIKSLYSLTTQIQDIWTVEISRIFSAVKRDQILLPSEPKTRDEFLQLLVPLSLDPNTAHRNLRLTQQNRAVVCGTESQSYPEHPERFQWWTQVLTAEGLTGRCYWEVIWTGHYGVDIAVAYKDIKRSGDGDDGGFGYNRHSWSLDCCWFRCALVHNNTETEITGVVSHRIGVYLDHRAGRLSFYSITDTMKHLHTLHTCFTHALYPGFGLLQGSTAAFCGPK